MGNDLRKYPGGLTTELLDALGNLEPGTRLTLYGFIDRKQKRQFARIFPEIWEGSKEYQYSMKCSLLRNSYVVKNVGGRSDATARGAITRELMFWNFVSVEEACLKTPGTSAQ